MSAYVGLRPSAIKGNCCKRLATEDNSKALPANVLVCALWKQADFAGNSEQKLLRYFGQPEPICADNKTAAA